MGGSRNIELTGRVFPGIMDGLGLFMYATGSMMDRKIGLGVNELPLAYHENATGSASRLMDGFGLMEERR